VTAVQRANLKHPGCPTFSFVCVRVEETHSEALLGGTESDASTAPLSSRLGSYSQQVPRCDGRRCEMVWRRVKPSDWNVP
jgi:hypothetical protein